MISQHLKLLSDHLSGLADHLSPVTTPPASAPVAPKLLSSLSRDEVVRLVHRPGSSPPPVHPCDRSNGSDTKTHWTSEELHRALGCCRFRNYRHIIQTSLDGEWVDGGDRGSTRKNVIFSNSFLTNSEYPISLKSMSIWSLQSFVEKNDPFLTYEPPKSAFFWH